MSQVFYRLHNQIKNYAWGSHSALNTHFHIPNPDNAPQAEVWMGTHPSGGSVVQCDGNSLSLQALIARAPEQMLGKRATQSVGQLPFLLKILAAEHALSLQVHPNKSQAEQGYARQGNKPGADYNDANHKPELIYAITPFMAMNGFRPYQEIIHHFVRLNASELTPAVAQFQRNPGAEGLKTFFTSLMTSDAATKNSVIKQMARYVEQGGFPQLRPFADRLLRDYPNDIGVLAPLFLHCLTLAPGEAMFLRAGTLHAYVHGTAVEVMACSDNVLRAGLSGKPVNLPELVKCTVFSETQAENLKMQPQVAKTEQRYDVPVDDFRFSIITLCQQQPVTVASAQILLVLKGRASLRHSSGETIALDAGQAVFIAACAREYLLTQKGECCLVSS